jgi:P27 family predicted phage terminase small subunit
MASPKPRPANLKLINGRGEGKDSGGRPVKQPPGFVRLPPEPPGFLDGEALNEWRRVVPELQRLQITKPVDRAALTAYCLTWQRLCDAQAEIRRNGGLLHENSQGTTRHPAVAIVEAASKELRAWCGEFGFTPSAEGRLNTPEGEHEENPFA